MPDPLRILIIARCPPYPLYWGDRLAIYQITHELARQGHIIDYLGFSQLDDDLDYLVDYEHLYREITLIPETPRSWLSYVQRLLIPASRFPHKAEQSWSPMMWQAIEALLQANPYDVVHLFGGVHVYEFYQLVANHNTIIMPYESYSLYLKRVLAREPNWMDYLRRQIAGIYEGFMFTPYRTAIVLAEPDRQELLSLNADLDVRVIPNGIDLTRWRVDDHQRLRNTLLFVGNYEYAPNLDAAMTLIHEIMPAIQAVLPHVRLQFVGNAPPPELQALASTTIDVIGRVDDVRPYLAQATIFVSPLQIGAGVKNKILEALAMGIPLVATPVSVDGIAVRDGEHALIAEVKAMPDVIIRLLQSPAQQKTLSKNARQLIETAYSTAELSRRYLSIYGEGLPTAHHQHNASPPISK